MATDTLERPTRIRYGVVVLATLVAVLLYVDRYCLSNADRAIKEELGLEEYQIANVLGAFFFTYALCQIPFGWLSDRFGSRKTLTAYMLTWSAVTGCLGLARGYIDLLLLRLGCGVFEAGAYPACAGIIRRWIPYPQRGLASGIVSLGGRLGGTITPKLTVVLMLAFAAMYPVGSWRPVLVIYGLLGLLLAAIFWLFFRDGPRQHPACNAAEAQYIVQDDPLPAAQDAASFGALVFAALANGSLWLCSLYQFGVNFGWVFLITYLNRYLEEVHGVASAERGTMGSLVIGISLPALLVGGRLTDVMTQRLGRRWGRCVPLVAARFLAAAAFVAVPFVTDPWAIVWLFGAAAFFSDIGLPALWAFNMDVGGRNVGFVLAWGNMWGNLGAAVSPIVINRIVEYFVSDGQSVKYAWDAVFFTFGVIFTLIGLAALGINATHHLDFGAPSRAEQGA